MTLSTDIIEVYANPQAPRRYIETLSFVHPGFTQSWYFTNDTQDWNFNLEDNTPVTFQTLPFEVVLPRPAVSGDQQLQITLANVGREMVESIGDAVRIPQTPIDCRYRVYLDVTGNTPENSPPLALSITDVQLDALAVTATATGLDRINRRFPSRLYTLDDFPGLRR